MKKIIVFDSVHYTIKADKILQSKELRYIIVTTPREISTDCGMSIETDELNIDKILEILATININVKVFDME